MADQQFPIAVGDRVTRVPKTFDAEKKRVSPFHVQMQPLTGTVVYIHPAGRYHTVAFEFPRGIGWERRTAVLRESFRGVER